MLARCLLLLAALTGAVPSSAQAQTPKIEIVASFSILADLVKQVGGDRVEVSALVGENSDAHVYQPKPADVARIGKAKLVVINGLGFENWADRLVKSARFQGERLVASRGVKTLKIRNAVDPHAWQDPQNIKIYVDNIRQALITADPAGAAEYNARAASYRAGIEKLEEEIRAAWAVIPKEQRKIITSHDSFAYYAAAFEVSFMSPQGVSTESEPSARDVAMLIRQIKRENTKAVFIENMSNRRLIDAIMAETGARIGGTLYSDALGGEVKTWFDMMRHNTKLLTEALK